MEEEIVSDRTELNRFQSKYMPESTVKPIISTIVQFLPINFAQ
jgi:hypothetical protein